VKIQYSPRPAVAAKKPAMRVVKTFSLIGYIDERIIDYLNNYVVLNLKNYAGTVANR